MSTHKKILLEASQPAGISAVTVRHIQPSVRKFAGFIIRSG